jgi:hypothetical protein
MNRRIIIGFVLCLLVGMPVMTQAQMLQPLVDKIQEVEARLAQLESMKKGSEASTGALKAVEQRVEDIESLQAVGYEKLSTDVSSIEEKLAANIGSANVTELESSVAELETQVAKVADGLETMQAETGGGEEAAVVQQLAVDLKQLMQELRASTDGEGSVEMEEEAGWGPMEITGFGDFNRVFQQGTKSGENMLGQVEFDIETSYDEKIGIVAAIAFNGESFELGEFDVDFHLFSSEPGAGYFLSEGIDNAGILAGQFDVPFGLDYMVFPSIDRKMVTGPLAIENMHDYWNDYGVQFYADNQWFNAVVFGLNGFGYEEQEMRMALGGRFGLVPHESIEIGGSFANFIDEDYKRDMTMGGVDLQLFLGPVYIKGEYIRKTMALASDADNTDSGFYLQGLYDFGRTFIFGRYGGFNTWEHGASDMHRFGGGGGVVIADGCEIRCEYQYNNDLHDVLYTQLVVGF